jgi:uncharacterized iron-regulated protein
MGPRSSGGGSFGGIQPMSIKQVVPVLLLGLALSAFTVASAETEESVLRLPIGDPARKDRQVELVLDAIVDTRADEVFTPGGLPDRVKDVRLLLVGEQHINVDFHRVQARVIRELHRAGREVLIGLEMYPYTEQRFLDQWSEGLLTEEGFLKLSEWYKHWGYDWDYYREIFLFARDHGLKIYALNTPRDVVSAVRKKGFENLTEEEASHVPSSIDTESDEHYRLFKTIFAEDAEEDDFHASLPEEQMRAMFDAQCTWDATMGFNAVRALRKHEDPGAILVVLVGGGHLAYDLGIQRQARQWFDGGIASLLPVSVGDICDPVETVQASYADFIWGVPPEASPVYPYLGLSTIENKADGRRKVIYVANRSPAEHAGFEAGDVLLTMDGKDVPDRATLKHGIAGKDWGDTVTFRILRGDSEVKVFVELRRERPEPCDDDEGGG